MFDLVIFDCDGVLIDSEIISANMLIAELAKLGVGKMVRMLDAVKRDEAADEERKQLEAPKPDPPLAA